MPTPRETAEQLASGAIYEARHNTFDGTTTIQIGNETIPVDEFDTNTGLGQKILEAQQRQGLA